MLIVGYFQMEMYSLKGENVRTEMRWGKSRRKKNRKLIETNNNNNSERNFLRIRSKKKSAQESTNFRTKWKNSDQNKENDKDVNKDYLNVRQQISVKWYRGVYRDVQ